MTMTMLESVGISSNFLLIIGHIKDPLKIVHSPSSPFIVNIATVDLTVSLVKIIEIIITFASTGYTPYENVSDIIQTTSTLFISVSFPAFLS